jgi:translation initiation factor IF-2
MKKEKKENSISKTSPSSAQTERPPVVVVLGHIDHGKSTLLDSIRKTNVVGSEAGGITQRLSAYELLHTDKAGKEKKITFLDTPGHEAFENMRFRGAEIADIAILVVSAEEGVKAQTLQALECVKKSGIPYVVAINKIDKPNADIERTKSNLIENEIYLEGLGGEVPWVAVSAKKGDGISDLLDMVLLVAELEELKGDIEKNAEGVVIEAHRDPKKGISATLIIKDGSLKSGMFISVGASFSSVRILEDFLGKPVSEARFSSPVQIIGFSDMPRPGTLFSSFPSKKEAEAAASACQTIDSKKAAGTRGIAAGENKGIAVIPIVLVVDVLGTLDAVLHEISKLNSEDVCVKIIQKSVGTISENDIKVAAGKKDTVVIGFNTNADAHAKSLADKQGIEIIIFDVIYKLPELLGEIIEERKSQNKAGQPAGRAEILKVFSRLKDKQVVGGVVREGTLSVRTEVRIQRKDIEVGRGRILNLQQKKADTKEVASGNEFGAQVQSKIEIAEGDILESAAPVKQQ